MKKQDNKPINGMQKQIAQQIDKLKNQAAAIPCISQNEILTLKTFYNVKTLKNVYKKLQHEIDFGVLGVLSATE